MVLCQSLVFCAYHLQSFSAKCSSHFGLWLADPHLNVQKRYLRRVCVCVCVLWHSIWLSKYLVNGMKWPEVIKWQRLRCDHCSSCKLTWLHIIWNEILEHCSQSALQCDTMHTTTFHTCCHFENPNLQRIWNYKYSTNYHRGVVGSVSDCSMNALLIQSFSSARNPWNE